MKISTEEVGRIMQTRGLVRTDLKGPRTYGRPAQRAVTPAADVEVSSQAQEVNRVAKLVANAPDVRDDQVQALKAKIESGTYQVSGDDIADLMIRRTWADSIR